MSTSSVPGPLSSALFGKTRRSVLALLLSHPDRSFYLREIARQVRTGLGAAQRELTRLAAAGVIRRISQGHQTHFRANPECPVFAELRGIVLKTSGAAEVLREMLWPLRDRIRLAFIYGSIARGEPREGSDVDLCVIGDTTFSAVVAALGGAHDLLGREVNPTVYPPDEFRRRLARKDHFLYALSRGPRIVILGDERELAGMAEQRLTSSLLANRISRPARGRAG